MKVLVKGNLVARKDIASMVNPLVFDIKDKVSVGKDTDYDLVIYGDILCDGVLMNGAEVYVSGKVVSLGKE